MLWGFPSLAVSTSRCVAIAALCTPEVEAGGVPVEPKRKRGRPVGSRNNTSRAKERRAILGTIPDVDNGAPKEMVCAHYCECGMWACSQQLRLPYSILFELRSVLGVVQRRWSALELHALTQARTKIPAGAMFYWEQVRAAPLFTCQRPAPRQLFCLQ